MKKKGLVLVLVLTILVFSVGSTFAFYDTPKMKTDYQKELFEKNKKEPTKASLMAALPGGGHFYNEAYGDGLFFVLENAAMAFLYNETGESFYLKAGLVIKLIEMSSAYDLTLKRNHKLRKQIEKFTKRIKPADKGKGLEFNFTF